MMVALRVVQPRQGWMDCAYPCRLDFHQLDGYLLCSVQAQLLEALSRL